jgi:hypothetical protein
MHNLGLQYTVSLCISYRQASPECVRAHPGSVIKVVGQLPLLETGAAGVIKVVGETDRDGADPTGPAVLCPND